MKVFDDSGFCHVYSRGVDKQVIFRDKQDYVVFLSYLKFYLSPLDDLLKQPPPSKKLKNYSSSIDLLCYCLMPNHFHLLIKYYSHTAATDFMRSLLTRYTMYFNKKYRRVGGLFQSRYKAVMIYSQEQLVNLTHYIHRNPDPTGSDLVGVTEYPYSSVRNYLGKLRQSWVKPDSIIALFSSENPNLSYLTFLLDIETENELWHLLIDVDPTGSDLVG